MIDPAITAMAPLTADQRLLFQARYGQRSKDRTTGLLLTLLLGGIGGHRFYLGQVGLGLLYLFFCWTFIPVFVSLVELFLIGRRVDRFNEALAAEVAAEIKILTAAPGPTTGSPTAGVTA